MTVNNKLFPGNRDYRKIDMNTKSKRKRYNHPNDIRDKIDKFRLKAQKLRDSAAALDNVADQFVKAGDSPEQVSFNREKAKKQRQAAGRIEDRTLAKLKEKLAEILTGLLPGIVDGCDRSIPVSTRKPKGSQ